MTSSCINDDLWPAASHYSAASPTVLSGTFCTLPGWAECGQGRGAIIPRVRSAPRGNPKDWGNVAGELNILLSGCGGFNTHVSSYHFDFIDMMCLDIFHNREVFCTSVFLSHWCPFCATEVTNQPRDNFGFPIDKWSSAYMSNDYNDKFNLYVVWRRSIECH